MLAVAFLSWGRRSGSLRTSSRRQITDSFSSPFISKSWTQQAQHQALEEKKKSWQTSSEAAGADWTSTDAHSHRNIVQTWTLTMNDTFFVFYFLPDICHQDKWWILLFYSKNICLIAIGMGTNSEQQIHFHYASCWANSVNSNIEKRNNLRVYFISAYIHIYEY